MAPGALRSLLGLIDDDEPARRLAADGGHAFVSSEMGGNQTVLGADEHDGFVKNRPIPHGS